MELVETVGDYQQDEPNPTFLVADAVVHLAVLDTACGAGPMAHCYGIFFCNVNTHWQEVVL